MAKIDKQKIKDWMDVKIQHAKDYATPITDRLEPIVTKTKSVIEPIEFWYREEADPKIKKATANIKSSIDEKRKAKAGEKKDGENQEAEDDDIFGDAFGEDKE